MVLKDLLKFEVERELKKGRTVVVRDSNEKLLEQARAHYIGEGYNTEFVSIIESLDEQQTAIQTSYQLKISSRGN